MKIPPTIVSQMGKIKIGPQWHNTYHRSGWAYAINSLQSLHSDNGVLLDGFVDRKFGWDSHNGWPPYSEPWIGFLHNPRFVPEWFGSGRSAEDIISTPLWRESLPYCRGLFTLSKYLANWLRPRTPAPVCSLFHPTASCSDQFSMDNYRRNKNRAVVHVGWWLRKVHSFFMLRTSSHQKILLLPLAKRELRLLRPQLKQLLLAERNIARRNLPAGSVTHPFRIEFHMNNEEYDRLLGSNIVYLDLYDSSANNTIVECIVRNTPMVINRHPAIVEYLGKDYPLYFRTAEEASLLAENEQRIHAAHTYLRDHHEIKERLTGEYFLKEFINSEIYQRLTV